MAGGSLKSTEISLRSSSITPASSPLVKAESSKSIVRFAISSASTWLVAFPVREKVICVSESLVATAVRPAGTFVTIT